MKKLLLFAVMAFALLTSTSCGMNRYWRTCNVKIEGAPNTDYYAINQRSSSRTDGFAEMLEREDKISLGCKGGVKLVGTTDENGVGVLKLASDEHRLSKGVYALKSGYEPVREKLRKKFNWATLLDIFFPPALFGDHYFVLSERKKNNITLDKMCVDSAADLFNRAIDEKREKRQIELYMRAFAQDYRNETGVAAMALNNLALIYADDGDVHEAYLLLKFASKYNTEDVKHNLAWLKGVSMRLNNEKHRKDEKFARTMAALEGIGSTLQAAGNTVAAYQGTTSGSSSSYSSSPSSSYSSPKTSSSSSSSSSTSGRDPDWGTEYRTNDRIYRDYESQLIKMQAYPEDYPNYTSKYSDIQSKMKDIRLKCERHGWPITKSPYE